MSACRPRASYSAVAALATLLLTATAADAQRTAPNAPQAQNPTQDPAVPELPFDDPLSAMTAPPADPVGIQVPSGGRPFVIGRVSEIPRQLKAAIDRAKCSIDDNVVAQYPVLIFRPADGRRLMAVVPCFGVTPDSRAFLFDSSVEIEPSPMMFPVIARPGGFSSSSQPGLMTWEPQTATLTAWRGSDICPAREFRYIYRQGNGELNGFALSKVEHRRLRCTMPEAEWQTLWQSPLWNLQP